MSEDKNHTTIPLRRDDLHVEELDGEAVAFDPGNGAVHRLNATTYFVWTACAGSRHPEEIAQSVVERYAIDADKAAEVASSIIGQLHEKELLHRNSRIAAGPGLSRRELLSGGVAKAVWAAPVISTFFAAGAYASGPSASGAFGPGGCKEGQYSCFVDTDCCQAPADRKCQNGFCCVKNNQPCNVDADCCTDAGAGCVDGQCRP